VKLAGAQGVRLTLFVGVLDGIKLMHDLGHDGRVDYSERRVGIGVWRQSLVLGRT
jgi:hypothetical protein